MGVEEIIGSVCQIYKLCGICASRKGFGRKSSATLSVHVRDGMVRTGLIKKVPQLKDNFGWDVEVIQLTI